MSDETAKQSINFRLSTSDNVSVDVRHRNPGREPRVPVVGEASGNYQLLVPRRRRWLTYALSSGARGLEIQGKFIKFTAIGVYLEEKAVASLADKWKGKTAEELADSVEFFADIVTGPFEKFTQVTMILPLTGQQYSEKVAENCVAHWKALGIYTEAEEKAIEKFVEVFKDETFPPGASILFTQSPLGSLTISFSKSCCLPEVGNAVIENKQLSQAILMSIIGKHGVSLETKQSLAVRMSDLLKKYDEKASGNGQFE